MITVGNEQIERELRKRFAGKPYSPSAYRTAREFYRNCLKKLEAPRLTKRNLMTVMRYIKRYHVKTEDYDRVIDKLIRNSSPSLSITDFRRFYELAAGDLIRPANHYGHNASPDDVSAIFRYTFRLIVRAVSHGKTVCIQGIGDFIPHLEKGRRYYNPAANQMSYSRDHYVVKFHASNVWNRSVFHLGEGVK